MVVTDDTGAESQGPLVPEAPTGLTGTRAPASLHCQPLQREGPTGRDVQEPEEGGSRRPLDDGGVHAAGWSWVPRRWAACWPQRSPTWTSGQTCAVALKPRASSPCSRFRSWGKAPFVRPAPGGSSARGGGRGV